jgi:signal transduction histidine kinase
VDAADRFDRVWHVLFSVTLIYPAAQTLVRPQPARERAVTLAVAVALGAVYWWGRVRGPALDERPARAVVFLGVVGALFAVLVVREAEFFFLLYSLYPLCFSLLPLRAAVTATVVLAVGTAVLLRGGFVALAGNPGALLGVVGSTLLAVTLGVFITTIAEQSAERSRVIAQLGALGRTSAALVAARTADDVVAALGIHLGLDAAALVDGDRVLARWPDESAPVGGTRLPIVTSAGAATALVLSGNGDERTWRTAADQAGLALDNLRLVERARTAGVLEERQRLAHEIHDTLAQGFTSVVLQLEAAEQALPDPPDAVRRHLDLARRTARESLTEVRRSVLALRPEALEDTPLPEAIRRITEAWSAETGVPATTTTTGTPRTLHPEVEVTLLRTVQEGLANARKHAGPQRVAVTLSYMEDLATLDVRDDGSGFDPAQGKPAAGVLSGGFGLTALRERVTRIGGELAVESAPGQGTALVATVPLSS